MSEAENNRADWAALLAVLESDVARGEPTGDWEKLKPTGPLPVELADRARRIVAAHRALVGRLTAQLADVRGQANAAARVPTDTGTPVFVDVQG